MFSKKLPGSGRALGRQAADEPWHVSTGAGGVARVNSFRSEGEIEVAAGARPDRSSSARNGPVVVPGKVRRLQHHQMSGSKRNPDKLGRRYHGARSGSLVAVIGVGTHTTIASAAARRPFADSDRRT